MLFFGRAILGILFPQINSHSRQTTAPSDEKVLFLPTRNILAFAQKFVTRDNKREKVSIEYPITENEKINRLISESIDKIDRDFQNTVLLATVF